MSRSIRFNGRDANDTLVTPPIAGAWHVGDEVEFSPDFCRSHNRQCRPPCEKGDLCDCWADEFPVSWNRGHENQPPFEVIDNDTAPPPEADATDEDAATAAEDQ